MRTVTSVAKRSHTAKRKGNNKIPEKPKLDNIFEEIPIHVKLLVKTGGRGSHPVNP
jgi:hypothetical protein